MVRRIVGIFIKLLQKVSIAVIVESLDVIQIQLQSTVLTYMIKRSTFGRVNNRMKRKPPKRMYQVSGFRPNGTESVERWLDHYCATQLESVRRRHDLGRVVTVVGDL